MRIAMVVARRMGKRAISENRNGKYIFRTTTKKMQTPTVSDDWYKKMFFGASEQWVTVSPQAQPEEQK